MGTIPGHENAPSRKIDKMEIPKVPSHLDAEKENAQAVFALDAQLQGKKKTSSRLNHLRTSTSGIETQVSHMNKRVDYYAGGENQTDV